MKHIFWGFVVLFLSGLPAPSYAQANAAEGTELSAAELFIYADAARQRGDYDIAETAYRALATNPDIEIRTEARFRLAKMLTQQRKLTDAAVLYRQILDEKPDAARVRFELAAVLAQMGNSSAAERELRQAQAAGLPENIASQVDIFVTALRSRRPIGLSLEVALAPDSNINRATQASTLDTVIAPLDLSEDAQAQSGIGLSLKGQAYFRTAIDKRAKLLVRLSADADLYRKSQFNDVSLNLKAGPEYRSGKDRISPSLAIGRRWYGGEVYADTLTASIEYQHPLTKVSLLNSNISIGHIDNKLNSLQSGEIYSGSVSYERALSSISGIGITAGGYRQDLRDAGYSTNLGLVRLLGYLEMGKTTAVATAGYSYLAADARLFLFPEKRRDNQFELSLSATFRGLAYKEFAPLLRAKYQNNQSTVGIYDYDRVAFEIGLTRAF